MGAEDDIVSAISEETEEFESVAELVASEPSVQIALSIMVVGLIAIGVVHWRVKKWTATKRFSYSRPHITKFVQSVMLPMMAFALITATNIAMGRICFADCGTPSLFFRAYPGGRELGIIGSNSFSLFSSLQTSIG